MADAKQKEKKKKHERLPEHLKTPLPLEQALDRLDRTDAIHEGSKPGIRSTVIDAMRYVLRVGDQLATKVAALGSDIRLLLEVLPAAAHQAAKEKGHNAPGEHRRRAQRFVDIILGGSGHRGLKRLLQTPEGWRELHEVKPIRGGAARLAFLSQCCSLAGFSDAPARMPTEREILDAAERINGQEGLDYAKRYAVPLYRRARLQVIDSVMADEDGAEAKAKATAVRAQFAAVRRLDDGRATHLGVEAGAWDVLEEMGLSPAEMTYDEILCALAPEVFKDLEFWRRGPGSQQSEEYRRQCGATLLRLGGWFFRAGMQDELAGLNGLDDLFYNTRTVASAAALNPRLAQRAKKGNASASTIPVSVLEYLAEREAIPSLKRSPVLDAKALASCPKDEPWFTESIAENCKRIWAMTKDVYSGLSILSVEDAERWGVIVVRWDRLKQMLTDRAIPGEYQVNKKDKLKMIRTVTLPQLQCVGLPLRRLEVREMGKNWRRVQAKAEAAGHKNPDEHWKVREAADLYFSSAVGFTALALTSDDGLRRKQYERGRLGYDANFSVRFTLDEAGKPNGIDSLTSSFSGRRDDPSSLKIPTKKGVLAKREGRQIRFGVVDRVVLWDLISYWRPRQLLAAGKIESLEAYDLIEDMKRGEFALFPSPRKVSREEGSSSTLGQGIGKELHYVVRRWLRPDLPKWDDLGNKWRGLWATHILRLLIVSYWGGVRKEWGIAMFLTQDTEAQLRAEYSEVDEGLVDLLGGDVTHWEHLKAYDPWMDRLYKDKEEFDPLSDPDLPIPPHLPNLLKKQAAEKRESEKSEKSGIRAARPGQPKPPGGSK